MTKKITRQTRENNKLITIDSFNSFNILKGAEDISKEYPLIVEYFRKNLNELITIVQQNNIEIILQQNTLKYLGNVNSFCYLHNEYKNCKCLASFK